MNIMVKLTKSVIGAVCLIGACTVAQAQTVEPVWINGVTITNLLVQPNKFIQVTTGGEVAVPDQGCNGNDGKTLELDPTTGHYKDQYTLLLAALMSKKKVSIYVSGCANVFPHANVTAISSGS